MTLEQFLTEILRQGFLGAVIAAFLTGHLVPKWVIEEARRREASKDAIIDRQARVIERLAGRHSRLSDLPPESPDG